MANANVRMQTAVRSELSSEFYLEASISSRLRSIDELATARRGFEGYRPRKARNETDMCEMGCFSEVPLPWTTRYTRPGYIGKPKFAKRGSPITSWLFNTLSRLFCHRHTHTSWPSTPASASTAKDYISVSVHLQSSCLNLSISTNLDHVSSVSTEHEEIQGLPAWWWRLSAYLVGNYMGVELVSCHSSVEVHLHSN